MQQMLNLETEFIQAVVIEHIQSHHEAAWICWVTCKGSGSVAVSRSANSTMLLCRYRMFVFSVASCCDMACTTCRRDTSLAHQACFVVKSQQA